MNQKVTRYSGLLKYIQSFVELGLLNLSFILAYQFKFGDTSGVIAPPYLQLLIFYNTLWVLVVLAIKPYNRSRVSSNNLARVFGTHLLMLIIHGFLMSLFIVAFKIVDFSRTQVLFSYGILLSSLFIWEFLYVYSLKYIRTKGYNWRNVVILGDGELSKELLDFFKRHPELGYKIINILNVEEDNIERINQILSNSIVHEIYCCLPNVDHPIVSEVIDFGEKNFIKIKLLSDFRGFAGKGLKLEYLDYIPVLNVNNAPFEDLRSRFVKRSFDVLFSSVVLILGLPIYLLIAIITKASSKGPIFYRQERIGRWGTPFYIYKFRSMYIDAEKYGPCLSKDNDPRITPWGRFMRKSRLDEIPQFYNVLMGQMSIVGPRPERQHFIDEIVKLAPHYRRLQYVKPGITSIGQVMFGYAENVEEMVKRLRYDILYLDNASLLLDVKMVALTVKVMIQGKGK